MQTCPIASACDSRASRISGRLASFRWRFRLTRNGAARIIRPFSHTRRCLGPTHPALSRQRPLSAVTEHPLFRRGGRPLTHPLRRSYAPRLERLEDRTVPSTLTVLNNLDSGPASLRALL